MSLTEYIDAEGRTRHWLAEQLGISRGYLSQLESGARVPSRTLALLIERVTGGAVVMVASADDGAGE